MGHYKSNVRDLEFNLFEVLELGEGAGNGRVRRSRRRVRAPDAGRGGAGWPRDPSPSHSRSPTEIRRPSTRRPHGRRCRSRSRNRFKAWRQGEWFRVGLDRGASAVCPRPRWSTWAINEMPLGANPPVFLYMAGPDHGGHHLPHRQRTAAASGQRLAIERNWAATMVLTEPDAGSDVGAGRTKAVEQPDGTWHIDGVKRFITNGDTDDLFENIMHLVLARPGGCRPGNQGAQPVLCSQVPARPRDRRTR